MGEKRGVGGFVEDVQLAVRQVAVQIFAHARRGDAVFAAEHQQRGRLDAGQQRTGVGIGHGIERGLQGGGAAVFDDVGQDVFQNRVLVFGVEKLELQKLFHVFVVILAEQRHHFRQRGITQAFGIIGRGLKTGETGGEAERAHFFGMACGQIQRHLAAERPAEDAGGFADLGGDGVGGGGHVKGAVKRGLAVAGQIGRADAPVGRQARDEVVEHMAVGRPAVNQVNIVGRLGHEDAFLVALKSGRETVCIMPRFGRGRLVRRVCGGYARFACGCGRCVPVVRGGERGRRGVRGLPAEAAAV